MICLILICLLSQAFWEMKSMEHSVFMSRKSRSNSLPAHSGYIYSRVNDQPFEYNSESSKPIIEKYDSASSEEHFEPLNFEYFDPEMTKLSIKHIVDMTEPPLINYAVDAAIAKAESEYNSKFLPSKIKTDAMYERLRSVMHYHPPDNTLEAPIGYDMNMNDYHLDDDDLRMNSRGMYDTWPYFYHSPYEYEHMKIDSEIEKAKDKRYAVDTMKVIPVYEKVNDVSDSYEYNMMQSLHESTTVNPITRNAPFFSFVLNDFNKYNDDDPLTFKGIEWGKEFDYQSKIPNIVEYTNKESQDVQSDFYNTPSTSLTSQNVGNYLSNNVFDKTIRNYGESSTDKSYDKKNEFDKFKKSNDHIENNKTAYEHKGNMNKSFKDFVDSFANKFGEEDHKKDSKYVFKINQDKGENKKGFRKVYHKDEYQEDHEFYDNNNNSAKVEENGTSKAHYGGSEAILQSQAGAALSNEGSAFKKAANIEDKLLKNNVIGLDFIKGTDNQFKRYRDVAKKGAQSNVADYIDHYRI